MCELFGLSAAQPESAADVLGEFRRRGGLAADNPDGWGIAWWEAGNCRLEKEPRPGHASARFGELAASTRAALMVAHVRKGNYPPINTVANTHPFRRNCCGRDWVFAHNGLVPEVVAAEQATENPVCRPDGDTDSEFAFCHLLSRVALHFHDRPLRDEEWLPDLAGVSELIAAHGKFNFLMADGDCLVAYGHDRLHHLENAGRVFVATEPLAAAGPWTPFAAGELRIYRGGRLAGRILTRP